jgi:hypothetical protein
MMLFRVHTHAGLQVRAVFAETLHLGLNGRHLLSVGTQLVAVPGLLQ